MSGKPNENPDGWDIVKRISEIGIIVGFGSTIHHKIEYDKWLDENEPICHGKIGLYLGIGSLFTRFLIEAFEPPRCTKCKSRTTYNPYFKQYYCKNCNLIVKKY
jgi:hypothetical protein